MLAAHRASLGVIQVILLGWFFSPASLSYCFLYTADSLCLTSPINFRFITYAGMPSSTVLVRGSNSVRTRPAWFSHSCTAYQSALPFGASTRFVPSLLTCETALNLRCFTCVLFSKVLLLLTAPTSPLELLPPCNYVGHLLPSVHLFFPRHAVVF